MLSFDSELEERKHRRWASLLCDLELQRGRTDAHNFWLSAAPVLYPYSESPSRDLPRALCRDDQWHDREWFGKSSVSLVSSAGLLGCLLQMRLEIRCRRLQNAWLRFKGLGDSAFLFQQLSNRRQVAFLSYCPPSCSMLVFLICGAMAPGPKIGQLGP